MPSSTTTRTPLPSHPHVSSSFTSTPLKRKEMSITQTYYLAHTARGKLSFEAARPDHKLRLLVGHANLLDSLMLELAEAEQEQESWFNNSVRAATKTAESPRHVQWDDSIIEEPEHDWQSEDADSESESESEFEEEEDIEMVSAGMVSLHRVQSQQTIYPDSDEEFEEDDEEDYASLTLARTPSRSAQPPELSHDSDDSSDDESMPPSPPSTTLSSFSEKQRQEIATTSFYEQSQSTKLSPTEQASFFDDGYYLPQRPEAQGLVSAISVY